MGRQLSTGRTPAAAFRARHAPTPVSSRPGARAGHLRTPWLPAPQPHVSIDFPGSFTVLSGIFTIIAWIYAVAMSYGGNSVVASLSFSCFLGSTLLGLGSAARLSAEFTREHYGYNIPLARRVFIWHRAMSGAVLLFYVGSLLMIGASTWALVDTRRTIAGVVLGLTGCLAIAGGAASHWNMVTHPLGVATDTIFSGPGYEFWVPGAGDEESGSRVADGTVPADQQQVAGTDSTASSAVLVQMQAAEASAGVVKAAIPADRGEDPLHSHLGEQQKHVHATFPPLSASDASPSSPLQTTREQAAQGSGAEGAHPALAVEGSPEGLGPLASSHGVEVQALVAQAQAHVHRASVASAGNRGPPGSSPSPSLAAAGQTNLHASTRGVSFSLPAGSTPTPSLSASIRSTATTAPGDATGAETATGALRTGTAARAPPPPLHITRPSSSSHAQGQA